MENAMKRDAGLLPHRRLLAILPLVILQLAAVQGGALAARPPQDDRRDSVQTPVRYRSPELAGAFSVFLPGAGHFYAGETVKGAVLSGLFIGGVVGVATANVGLTHSSIKPGAWASVVVIVASYLYALIDAPFAAGRTNERWHVEQPAQSAVPGEHTLLVVSLSF
jgi:hypothetical protein